MTTTQTRSARAKPDSAWFVHERFGLFVHWGHGSRQGWELSWPLVGGAPNLHRCQDVPAAEYHATARTFAPRSAALSATARSPSAT